MLLSNLITPPLKIYRVEFSIFLWYNDKIKITLKYGKETVQPC